MYKTKSTEKDTYCETNKNLRTLQNLIQKDLDRLFAPVPAPFPKSKKVVMMLGKLKV